MKTLLIKDADFVATLDKDNNIFEETSIYIEGNKIKDIGRDLNYPADKVIEGQGKIALPGFVNTHHHLYQTLTRNVPIVQDAKLFDWLVNLYEIWRELTPDAVYTSTLVGLGELLLTGCTLSTDMFYVFPKDAPPDLFDQQIRAAKSIGIRFHPCRGSMSRGCSEGGLPPDDVVQTEEEILADCQRVIEAYHDPSPLAMTRIALGPCSPFSVTTELMQKTIKLARKLGVRCHTHLAETLDEDNYCLDMYGKRPFDYIESVGWLGEDVWFAHCVHLNESEIKRMAKTATGMAHCPVSNLRLGSGIAPVPAMLKAGVPVGLAVDGSASNDSSDMLGELRQALLVHRYSSGVDSITALDVLKMAAQGGAKVLGWQDEVGILENGRAADIILIDLQRLGFAGSIHDPLAAVIFAGDSHIVDTSIVNGEVVVKGGRLVKVNEDQLIEEANQVAVRMVERAAKRTGINFLQKKQQLSPVK